MILESRRSSGGDFCASRATWKKTAETLSLTLHCRLFFEAIVYIQGSKA
jgi:hypothetical protein